MCRKLLFACPAYLRGSASFGTPSDDHITYLSSVSSFSLGLQSDQALASSSLQVPQIFMQTCGRTPGMEDQITSRLPPSQGSTENCYHRCPHWNLNRCGNGDVIAHYGDPIIVHKSSLVSVMPLRAVAPKSSTESPSALYLCNSVCCLLVKPIAQTLQFFNVP